MLRIALVIAFTTTGAFAGPPGVVIDHSPAASGIYVGSPAIAILPSGTYVAAHDEFGPHSSETTSGTTHVFASTDRGATWSAIATFDSAFWGSLFVRERTLFWIGATKQFGDIAIRSSSDEGKTWTAASVIVRGAFHCAPTPVVIGNGRIWRAFEVVGRGGWPGKFEAAMISAPVDADLTKPESWTTSRALHGDHAWRGNRFRGWLEGNAIVTPDAKVVDVLRVVDDDHDEHAALATVAPDGKSLQFDPTADFLTIPGGGKKFTIRYDAASKLYWSLVNYVPRTKETAKASPDRTRNTLALVASPDLVMWQVRAIVLAHSDRAKHAFQYVDWQFDGDDLVAVSRTAFDDDDGGAHDMHDANYLTFHRVEKFRSRAIPHADH